MQPQTWMTHRTVIRTYLVGQTLVWGVSRQTDSNEEEGSHWGPPCSPSLASCISSISGTKILRIKRGTSLVFSGSSWATRKDKHMKQQLEYSLAVAVTGSLGWGGSTNDGHLTPPTWWGSGRFRLHGGVNVWATSGIHTGLSQANGGYEKESGEGGQRSQGNKNGQEWWRSWCKELC